MWKLVTSDILVGRPGERSQRKRKGKSEERQPPPSPIRVSAVPKDHWLRAYLQREVEKYGVVNVDPDGDCFFSSVAIILRSVGLEYTTDYLRSVVAYPVLESSDEKMNQTIQNWIEIYNNALKTQDRELLFDYAHVASIAHEELPLNQVAREKLYRSMMNKNVYWGEQHAFRVLESMLQAKFIVIDDNSSSASVFYEDDFSENPQPSHFMLLALRRKHYVPLCYDKKFIFTPQKIPIDIDQLC